MADWQAWWAVQSTGRHGESTGRHGGLCSPLAGMVSPLAGMVGCAVHWQAWWAVQSTDGLKRLVRKQLDCCNSPFSTLVKPFHTGIINAVLIKFIVTIWLYNCSPSTDVPLVFPGMWPGMVPGVVPPPRPQHRPPPQPQPAQQEAGVGCMCISV